MESSSSGVTSPLISIRSKKTTPISSPSTSFNPPSDVENSPIDQVALTVPVTDDPSIPVLTFRMWLPGSFSCVLLAFLNQFFGYRTQPLSITSVSAQIAVMPLGHFMALTITDRVFFKGRWCEFTLNPGPFNVKEHVLIAIFANSGTATVFAIDIVNAARIFYRKNLTFFVSLLVVLTSQILGFGWAGIFRRFLVEPAAMWWPQNLVQVSLFRALHEKENRPKGQLTRNQFFVIATICSFAYYVFPGYIFPMLTSLSWICWVFPSSVVAHQLGSGLHGLGVGALGLDWSTTSSYLGSPLASPWFATANVAVGFFVLVYIITPIAYWLDVYNAKTFPVFPNSLFTKSGHEYNISSIIDSDFHLDVEAYQRHGPLYLSILFALSYGAGFATLSATVVHIILFHGRELLQMSKSAFKEMRMDIHTRLMQRVDGNGTEWWFMCMLAVTIGVTIFACESYNEQLQQPWWGVLLACVLSIFFTLPIGIITATTNQTLGLNIISELILGYAYPGRPVANMCFKTYTHVSMRQAVTFLQDFKLGHYMKVPPRIMFMAQVVGSLIAAMASLGTAWWLMGTIRDICDVASLPANSPWTCPSDHIFYDASVIWGLIGPRRIFGDLGTYSAINWSFLAGAIAPLLVWFAHKAFPNHHWIRLVNMPILIGATHNLPPATPVNFTSWIIVGLVSGFLVFRYRRDWWQRHNYALSGALDAGLAFMGGLLYLTLGLQKISLDWWGSPSLLAQQHLVFLLRAARFTES